MNKCLVTSYTGTVDNSDLPVYGKFKVHVSKVDNPTQYTNVLYLKFSKPAVVKTVNGEANLTSDSSMQSGWSNTFSIPANQSTPIYCKNGDYDLIVNELYSLLEYGGYTTKIDSAAFSVNGNQFKYCQGLTQVIPGRGVVEADISSFYGKTLYYLGISNMLSATDISAISNLTFSETFNCYLEINNKAKLLYGDFSDIAPLPNLKNVQLYGHTLTGTTRDIQKAFPNISTINVANIKGVSGDIADFTSPLKRMSIYHTNITGSLESFVATQRAQGRTTGACSNGGWFGSNITFNGSVASVTKDINVTWTADTITFNDVTINA